MKRTTVYFKELTDLELNQLARQQERPKAELIREAVETYIKQQRKPFELPDWVGMVKGKLSSFEEDEALLEQVIEEDYERVMAEWAVHEESRDSS